MIVIFFFQMSPRKLARYFPQSEPWSFGKGSNYYKKKNEIKNLLINFSGGNIVEMLTAALTNDEVCLLFLKIFLLSLMPSL